MKKLKSLVNSLMFYSNPYLLKQLLDLKSIPFIIINFNQLEHLRNLVDFAIKRGFKNIVIIDNKSTYPPLLDYYKTLSLPVIVEYMSENLGHRVLMNNEKLYSKYCRGLFILTDADIRPNKNLPADFLEKMTKLLLKKRSKVTKVGFALDLENIPDYYPAKEKVIKWEKQFWSKKISDDIYYANIDTTFALYIPNPKKTFVTPGYFVNAIRMAGDYTCDHMGWYINYNNLNDEQLFYNTTASNVSSWKLDSNGKPIESIYSE